MTKKLKDSKIQITPFIAIISFLIAVVLFSVIFQKQLQNLTDPQHLNDLELNTLSPAARKLVLKTQSNLKQIEKIEPDDQEQIQKLLAVSLKNINEAVKLDPENSYLWLYRCRVYKGLKDIKNASREALKSCKKSLELTSDPKEKEKIQQEINNLR